MLNVLLFVLINSLIIVNSYFLVKRYLDVSIVDTIIIVFILFFAHIVFINTCLGIIGKLEYKNITICLLLTLLCEIFVILRQKKFNKIEYRRIYLFNKENLIFSIILVFISILLFNLFVWGLVIPPPLGGDAFTYHLVFPVAWLKAKKIYIHPTPFGDQAPAYAPSNSELLYLWLISPFNEDFLTNVGQFLFFIIGSVALYSISIKMGIVNEFAILSSLTFLLTPGLIRQSTTADVDLMFASVFIITINLLLLYKEKFNFPSLIFLSISTGLFLGIKFISVPYSLFIVIPIVFLIFKEFKKLEVLIAKLSVFIVFIIVFSGYWFIRNFVATGSAFYPLTIKFLGFTLMKGAYYRNAMLNSYYHITDLRWIFENLYKEVGVGIGLIVLVSFFICFYKLILKKEEKFKIYIFLLPILLFLCFWFIIPYNSQVRFLYPAIGLSYLFIPYAFYTKSKINNYIKIWILMCAFGSIMQNNHIFLVCKEILLAISGYHNGLLNHYRGNITIFYTTFVTIVIFYFLKFKDKKIKFFLLISIFFLFSSGLYKTKLTHESYKYFWYARSKIGIGWFLVNKISEKPLNIAYAGNNVPYGLYGSGLRNNVFYINTSEDSNWRWHDFAKKYEKLSNFKPPINPKPAYYRRDPDFMSWLKNLKIARIDVLFISVLHPHEREYIWHDEDGFPIEKRWAEIHPEYFDEINKSSGVRIYSVRNNNIIIKAFSLF